MRQLGRAWRCAIAASVALALNVAVAGPAVAGQPGVSAGNECGATNPETGVSAETRPGKSESAKGSAFNSEGRAGEVYAGNPGTKSLEHAHSEHAVSQYDIACVQASK
jgi:hypothetical protein